MIHTSPEHEQADSWIGANYVKDLTKLYPGKVFFFVVRIFKKVLANTSNTMYNKGKDKGIVKKEYLS